MTVAKTADAAIKSSVVSEYSDAIEAWSETLLRPYLDWLSGPGTGKRSSKLVNDPVWGTIILEPQEVVVMDSPLLQRLRRIRQLGVVHLVYPGANHTRFEHSLGVTHQVGELIRGINRSNMTPTVDESLARVVRLAALMHDVGHGLMSHVVENALDGNEKIDQLQLEFKREFKRSSKAQLSEMAAFFMINSPAVQELIERAYAATESQPPENINTTIAKIVGGIKVDDRIPFLHELISGPFDADKLDYMPRDAKMCGVPVVTDVVRLIQKVRSVPVSTDELPPQIRGVGPQPTGHHIFGVARSGASALDEVSLNRSLMFDKVYRHHKVRAIESMVAAAVQILHPLLGDDPSLVPLYVMDDEFVELDANDLKSRNSDRDDVVSEDDLAAAIDITTRIRDRQLFSRAFAFASTMPGDAYKDDRFHEPASERFVRELGDGNEHRIAFTRVVVEHVDRIATVVGDRTELDRIGVQKLHHYIRIDPPASGGHGSQSDQSRAFLIDERDHLIPVSKERAETRPWADAYVNTKDVGFIFAPREIANMVHIASEIAAFELYELRVPDQMHDYAKKGGRDLTDLRRDLLDKGFYKDLPRDLAPLPEFFGQSEATRMVNTALENLRGYMGPTHRQESPDGSGSTLNSTKIIRWAAQFSSDHHESALKVASSIRMLSRDDANEALAAFAAKNPDFEGASYVALGEEKDGSVIMAYHLRDSAAELGYALKDIINAVRDENPIIFVDDFVGLGRSAEGIFKTYMGLDGGAPLGETRTKVLDESEQARLKSRKVALVWEAGFQEGADHIVSELQELGIDATAYIHTPAETLPTVFTALNGLEPSEIEAFLEECRSIGRQLLEPDTDPDKLEERLLGYGNFGLLVTNSYNSPSVTLTALTRSGQVDDRQWNALITRLKKT